MMNLVLSWLSILALVFIPLLTGMVFEQKLQAENRELGSRLLHRY